MGLGKLEAFVRQISSNSASSVESIKQRRNLLDIKSELERVQRKLDRAERALESLSAILALIPDPIEVVTPDHAILFANRASKLLHDNEQLEGTLYHQSVMGLEQPPSECPIRRAIEDDREAAYTATCENGEVVEVAVTPVVLSDGRRAAMCLTKLSSLAGGDSTVHQQEAFGLTNEDGVPDVDDITLDDDSESIGATGPSAQPDQVAGEDEPADEERQLLQQIAEMSTQTLDAVLDQVSDGVLMTDMRGTPILTNSMFRVMAGIESEEELDADLAARILFPDREDGSSAATALAELTASGGRVSLESSMLCAEGVRVGVNVTVSRVPSEKDSEPALLITVRFDDNRELLTKALSDSQVVDRITGLAHQVNNYLTPALYEADKLARRENLDARTRQAVVDVQNYLNLSHESISMVLYLTRPDVPSPVNVNHLVSELLSRQYLAEELRRDNIEVVQRHDPGMVEVTGNRLLLQQALANIIKNAREAMVGAKGGGRLMVLTESSTEWITIRISDDGPGIAMENQDKLFDLRYTTKPQGVGHGVGLYFSREVVTRHGGTIKVKSLPGAGASFVVRLPARNPESVASLPSEPEFASRPTVFAEMSKSDYSPPAVPTTEEAAAARILVIDDEPGILELLSDLLSGEGHTVDTANDTIDALKKIRSTSFDCVVCDIRMPDIDGPELARIIEEHDIDLRDRLIFVTGDILSQSSSEFIEESGAPCIAKPFNTNQVRDVVRYVLAARSD